MILQRSGSSASRTPVWHDVKGRTGSLRPNKRCSRPKARNPLLFRAHTVAGAFTLPSPSAAIAKNSESPRGNRCVLTHAKPCRGEYER